MNIAKPNVRPTLNPNEIDQAISQADLSDIESEILEYILKNFTFNVAEISLADGLIDLIWIESWPHVWFCDVHGSTGIRSLCLASVISGRMN